VGFPPTTSSIRSLSSRCRGPRGVAMPWHDLSSPELGDHQAADLVSTTQSIDKAGRGGKGSFSPHSYSYVEWWTRSWVPLLLITGYNTIDCPFILSLKSFGRSSALRFVERGKKKKKVNTDELPLTELSRKSPASGIYIFYLCFAQESITPNHSSSSLSYPSLAALHKAYLQAASEL
jgi:hypothetical protein